MPAVISPIHAVDRPQLRGILDQAAHQPLTLLVAPAGSGKSILLAQWVTAHPELAFVWIELTTADDDPVRFAQRLLGGLADIRPELASLNPLVALHGGGLGRALLEALRTELTELPEVVIVLDDLHRLSNASLIADLGQLVDLLPINAHMVVASRSDLPISWSRIRLSGAVTEIRQADLAFDDVDSAFLLEHISGRALSADAVAALVNRTEGWAAGLQLAAITLRLYANAEEFIVQFSGDDRLIADYLSAEVLQGQPDHMRDLLVRISVLDQFDADIVSHLTGDPNAQRALEELERESMFLIPLDSHRTRYRFHHLFRDMLRYQLRAAQPELEGQLLASAATWYLHRGDIRPGVECLLRAKDWDQALNVIMGQGSGIFEHGEMATVIRWIEEIPESVRSKRHDVSLSLAFLWGTEGQMARAEHLFRAVAEDSGATEGERACAQVFLAAGVQWRSRPETSFEFSVQALERLEALGDKELPAVMNLADAQSLRTLAIVSGGRALFLLGRMDEAREWMERALGSAGVAFSIWKIGTLGSLGQLEAWCGQLGRAQALAEESLNVALATGLLSHPVNADAFLATTFASLERGEPHRAALSLHEGILRSDANRRAQLQWICHLARALVLEAAGKADEAETCANLSMNELASSPPLVASRSLDALRIRLARNGGDFDRAHRLAEAAGSESWGVMFERALLALSTGRPDGAEKLLGEMEDGTPAGPIDTVQQLVLTAWLERLEGSEDASARNIAAALDLAECNSLSEVFVRVGPPIVELLFHVPEAHAELRQKILDGIRRINVSALGGGLIDPLTNREMEILSHLPSRLTNVELARQCFVSENTVKTHIAHIYQKLGVAHRNEAIVRGRELGLL
jgi:LuxR family transcriptional regulator, maltose regulon positive regulatory protein